MIIGIGTDIVRVSRIQATINRSGDALAKRVLTPMELEIYSRAANPAAYLAKRFAAKEAASKALGTGIGKISWQDIQVVNSASGAPQLQLFGNARSRLEQLGADSTHLSLADEVDEALAFVIVSKSC